MLNATVFIALNAPCHDYSRLEPVARSLRGLDLIPSPDNSGRVRRSSSILPAQAETGYNVGELLDDAPPQLNSNSDLHQARSQRLRVGSTVASEARFCSAIHYGSF